MEGDGIEKIIRLTVRSIRFPFRSFPRRGERAIINSLNGLFELKYFQKYQILREALEVTFFLRNT